MMTKVALFGDSISAGVGWENEEVKQTSVAQILSEQLGVPIDNQAMGGVTTENALTGSSTVQHGAPPYGTFEQYLQQNQPEVVLLRFGAADAIRLNDPDRTLQNLQQMINIAKRYGAKPILIGTAPFQSGAGSTTGNIDTASIDPYINTVEAINQGINRLASENSLRFVDVRQVQPSGNSLVDGVHPTSAYGRSMAEYIGSAIQDEVIVDPVTSLYREILGRDPQQGGLDYWTQQFGDTIDESERQEFLSATMQILEGKSPEEQALLAPKLVNNQSTPAPPTSAPAPSAPPPPPTAEPEYVRPSNYVYDDDDVFSPYVEVVGDGSETLVTPQIPHERLWQTWAQQEGIRTTTIVGFGDNQEQVVNPAYTEWKANKKAQGYDVGMQDIPGINYTKNFSIIGPDGNVTKLANGSDATFQIKTGSTFLEGLKELAPIVIMAITANPELAASVGAKVNTALNLGLTGNAVTSLGSAVISAGTTAIQGGDVGQVVTSAVTAGAGAQLNAAISSALPSVGNPVVDNAIKQAVTSAATEGIKVVLGQEGDIGQAFTSGLLSGATSASLDELKAASDFVALPKPIQSAITAGASALLAGKDTDAALKAGMMAAISTAAKEAMPLTDAQRTAMVKEAYKQVAGSQAEPTDARALEIYRQAEADIGEARTIYEMTTGSTLSDDAIIKAAQSGDPFKYIDDLYTTADEATALWRSAVGTNPTEDELEALIGKDYSQVTNIIGIAAQDYSDTTPDELDRFLESIGQGNVTLTPEERISLLAMSEVQVRNAIAGKYNTFVEDFNTVTATEAQQRWEDAGNVRPMTSEEMFAMLAGNHDTADRIAQRTADFEQEVFNGNDYATQEQAQAAAKEREVFGQYLYNGRIYSVDHEVPYKSNAASREQAVFDAIRNNKGLVEWDGKILKVPKDYDAALREIENASTFTEAYDKAVARLGPDAPFNYKGENFRTKQAFDGSTFTDKGAAALAAYQNGGTSFVFSDGKTYNLPDNFDQIAGDALLEEASIPLRNAALADLLRPEIQAVQEERLQTEARESVKSVWDRTYGKIGFTMPEPGTEAYDNFVALHFGGVGGAIKAAVGVGHWLQAFDANNSTSLTDEQIREYGDFGGEESPEDIRKSHLYGYAKYLQEQRAASSTVAKESKDLLDYKIEGKPFYEAIGIGASEIWNGNYQWAVSSVFSNLPEEIINVGIGRSVYSLTKKMGAALGVNAIVDFAQGTGDAYTDQLEYDLANGVPYDVAVLRASAIAPVIGAVNSAADFVGDKLLFQHMADSTISGLKAYLKSTGKVALAESFAEGLGSGASEAISQYYRTGKFDIDAINSAITVGAYVGPMTAVAVLTPNAASRVVGAMYDGTAATVQDLLNQNPNFDYSTLNRSEPIFDFGGNQLSVDRLGNVLDNNATNPNFTPAGYITTLNGLGEAGYIDVTAPEVALAVTLAPDANTLTTQLQDMGLDFGTVLDIADTKFDSSITTRDEAGSLTGTGTVLAVDPETGEALVRTADGGITVVTNPGANVGDTLQLEAPSAPDVTPAPAPPTEVAPAPPTEVAPAPPTEVAPAPAPAPGPDSNTGTVIDTNPETGDALVTTPGGNVVVVTDPDLNVGDQVDVGTDTTTGTTTDTTTGTTTDTTTGTTTDTTTGTTPDTTTGTTTDTTTGTTPDTTTGTTPDTTTGTTPDTTTGTTTDTTTGTTPDTTTGTTPDTTLVQRLTPRRIPRLTLRPTQTLAQLLRPIQTLAMRS
jgi:lysophospholipase L1-like esterase